MRAMYSGLFVSEVISHAAPTLCMKVPMSETRFEASRFLKVGFRRGRHGPGEAVASG
jgi:hypothetical protein